MAAGGSDLARLRMIISGRVQGVFFRQSAADRAHDLGLKGFARNLTDGSVEIVAEGVRRNLEMLLAWARQGPPRARVDDVRAEWGDFQGQFSGFAIR
jgi:acylphosphatase